MATNLGEGMMPTERRNVLVGIRMDNHGRELLSWALVKVAEPGDCVIAVHVCGNSKAASDRRPLLDSYLEVYGGLCSLKKVDLIGRVCTGSSSQRILVSEAKSYGAVALVVGISRQRSTRNCTAGYCAKQLPSTTNVLGIHNGKIVFGRCNSNQLTGPGGDPRPSLNLLYCTLPYESQSEFGDSDRPSFDVVTRTESGHSQDDDAILANKSKEKPNSADVLDQRPGWPLLTRATSADPLTLQARELSVVQWAMNLPNRSTHKTQKIGRNELLNSSNGVDNYSQCGLQNAFEILLKTNSSSCKWFNYEVLKTATSKFSSANLIGEGECSSVYKGTLPDGKLVAVKIQNSSQETWNQFSEEVEIISSLDHNNIIRLKGVCIKDSNVISVYDFFSRGSLESNLHGKKGKISPVPWKLRYDIAIKIAEALNYLHSKCSRPVIHRDIKSSNILLTHEFEPQLCDFGLAIWRPTSSSYTVKGDVAGTFGYFAPEYFMYGKVSDKIDVYAFGVVLLELLSGKQPIASDIPKGKGSLVMWANSVLESGNIKDILDPNLDKNMDEGQMIRMIVAAKLCITRSAKLRPKMSEILKLLRGEKDREMWVNVGNKEDDNDEEEEEEEEAYYSPTEADNNSHINVTKMENTDDDSISYSSSEQGNIVGIEEYMKARWSRSSSFN